MDSDVTGITAPWVNRTQKAFRRYDQRYPLKKCSYKFRKFHRNTLVLESFFNKVAGLNDNFILTRDFITGAFMWHLRNLQTMASIPYKVFNCYIIKLSSSLQKVQMTELSCTFKMMLLQVKKRPKNVLE